MSRVLLGAPTIKVALMIGFGLTLAMWLGSGYVLTLRMTDMQRRTAAINDRYAQAQELLSIVQQQTLLGSVYGRDFLLDPDRDKEASYRGQLMNTYRAADEALELYDSTVTASTERQQLERLRREIAGFRVAVGAAIGLGTRPTPEETRVTLSQRVAPAREAVMRAAEDARAQNRSTFIDQQSAIPAIFGAVHRQAIILLGLALAASLGIALLATVFAGRLERRLVQSKHDLQRLSAKLITAQEEERRTIARELHDEIGQVLSAVKVELALVRRKIGQAGAPPELLDDVQSLADGAVTTVRDLSQLLHPGLLDDLGLAAALDWYVRGFSRRHAIRVVLHCEPFAERLLPEIEASLYRIVQEALTNVARHARASECLVSVRTANDALYLVVEDDGGGFDRANEHGRKTERGLGLLGIRERVSELLGRVEIDSAPGRGTRLIVELPARTRTQPSLSEEIVHA